MQESPIYRGWRRKAKLLIVAVSTRRNLSHQELAHRHFPQLKICPVVDRAHAHHQLPQLNELIYRETVGSTMIQVSQRYVSWVSAEIWYGVPDKSPKETRPLRWNRLHSSTTKNVSPRAQYRHLLAEMLKSGPRKIATAN